MRPACKSAALVALVLSLASISLRRDDFRHSEGPRWKTVQGRVRRSPGYGFKDRDECPVRQRRALSHRKFARGAISIAGEGRRIPLRAAHGHSTGRRAERHVRNRAGEGNCALDRSLDLSRRAAFASGTRQGQADNRLLPLPRFSEPDGRPSTGRNRLARSRQLHAHQLWLPAERCQREGRRRRHRVSHEIFRAGFAAGAFSRGAAGVRGGQAARLQRRCDEDRLRNL